jgi:predicted dinucleotide-binding enzyme
MPAGIGLSGSTSSASIEQLNVTPMKAPNNVAHRISSNPHHGHQHWQRRALAATFLGTLVFGTIGYQQYDPATRLVDALYSAAQLFAMHAPHLEGRIPWTLEVGRWLGAFTTVLALFQVIKHMFREEWDAQRISRIKNHVVVCGLGRKGLAAARHLTEQGKQVVVIEKSPAPDMVEACRELGAHVLTGDAVNPDILQGARIESAESLIAICPDDATNCEIAANASRLRAAMNIGAPPLQCRVQAGDMEARSALQEMLAQKNAASGAVIHFFDSFDPEARRLLVRGLPIDHDGIKPDDKRDLHLVILGFGRMGRALAVRAAQLGVFAAPGRLKISVIDRRADVHSQALRFHHAQVADVCDIEFHQQEAISPETRKLLKDWCARRDSNTSLAVCFDNEQLALEIAVQLRQLIEANDVRVAVRLSGQSGLARLMEERRGEPGSAVNFHPFGTQDYSLANDSGERFARQIHAAYIKMRCDEAGQDAAKLEKLAKDSSMKDWDDMTEDLRESNRQQADHIHIKLRALGLKVADEMDSRPAVAEFTPAQIELLAEMEHRRWMAERRMANWTYAPAKNEQRRENPNLVSWDKLPENIKDYDRNAVREIPMLLAEAKIKIYRKDST